MQSAKVKLPPQQQFLSKEGRPLSGKALTAARKKAERLAAAAAATADIRTTAAAATTPAEQEQQQTAHSTAASPGLHADATHSIGVDNLAAAVTSNGDAMPKRHKNSDQSSMLTDSERLQSVDTLTDSKHDCQRQSEFALEDIAVQDTELTISFTEPPVVTTLGSAFNPMPLR